MLEDDNNLVDICYGPIIQDGSCSFGEDNLNISSVKKIDDIELDCIGGENCLNMPLGCTTVNDYPGRNDDQQFDTIDICKDYFGTDNTWGTCISFNVTDIGTRYTLGCVVDSDCPDERKCIQDGNPLNPLKKACSCSTNDDCVYKNSGETKCSNNNGSFGYGKVLCSSYSK